MRLAKPAFASSVAPYASPIDRSVSHSRRKGNSNFSAKARFSSTLSNETPRICAPFSSISRIRSRNPQPSMVHPGVSAFG
jgi:hypothetical protein